MSSFYLNIFKLLIFYLFEIKKHQYRFIIYTIIIILKMVYFITFLKLFLSLNYFHTILHIIIYHPCDYNMNSIYPIYTIYTLYSKSKNSNKFGCFSATFSYISAI